MDILMPSHKATYKPDPNPEREKKYAETLGEMIRCETVAFTMQSGSENYNSIPQEATLGANVRFIPHQGMDESLKILETIVF